MLGNLRHFTTRTEVALTPVASKPKRILVDLLTYSAWKPQLIGSFSQLYGEDDFKSLIMT